MKRASKKYFLQVILATVFGTCLFFQSCINDNMDDCAPAPYVSGDTVRSVRIFFEYDDVEQITDADPEVLTVEKGIRPSNMDAVSQVDLYVFDAVTGVYIDKYTDLQPTLRQKGIYYMPVSLAAGYYKFVAWGGLRRSNFAIAPVTPIKHISHFSDFSVNYLFPGDTITAGVDNLYYGVLDNVVITPSTRAEAYDSLRLHLRQDTYMFNIRIDGTAVRSSDPVDDVFETVIAANNSYYDFDNSLISAPTNYYKSGFSPVDDTGTEWYTSRSTLMINDRGTIRARPMLKFYRNGEPWRINGLDEGIDLIDILQRYAVGRLQLDFTTMYVFYMRFTIDGNPDDETSLSVGVSIGNWNFSVSDNELHM
ncbi:MAG: FimB/Mfa2 family fimbrial subunit [Tannerella sp.]|jgi:hypothetical protein|nr:FimB/Mfa2 family fimbrial subunit [Tannerella sp.]